MGFFLQQQEFGTFTGDRKGSMRKTPELIKIDSGRFF